MVEAGYFESNRISPTGIVFVVALHAALITAGVLAKSEVVRKRFTAIVTYPVPDLTDPPPIPEKPKDTPVLPAQQESHIETMPPIVPTEARDSGFPIDTGPFGGPANLTSAGATSIDPPPPPPLIEPAKAKGDVRRLFSANDYPAVAQRRGESGSLRARLLIGTDGRVSGCQIVESSGHSSLDSATCRILKARAHFTPAKDGSGQATNDSYVTPPITWQLREGEG
jgi:protein TonB